jgi:hypothetical protein
VRGQVPKLMGLWVGNVRKELASHRARQD